jgi:apolipoprotein N-acyltransferase
VEPRWFVLGWIGLVPWLAVLDGTESWRGALASAVLMSVAFVLGVFGWFAGSIATYTGVSASVAFFLLVLGAPLLQPQFLAYAVVRHVVRRRAGLAYTALAGATAYVGAEWLFPKLFGDTIGHGFLASPTLRQAADLGGAHAFTFVLIVANECVRIATSPARWRAGRGAPACALVCVAAMVTALAAYGSFRLGQLASEQPPGAPIRAGLVQADIAQYDRMRAEQGTFSAVREILDAHLALSAQALARGVDLLVWPETVYPTTFGSPKSPEGGMFDRAIAAFAARAGVPIVFGAYDTDGQHEFNAAVFLEPGEDGRMRFDAYRKARLFPLTERLPALLESDAVRAWMPWLGTWHAGAGAQAMQLALRDGRTLRVAPLICLDAVDPSLALAAVRRGAEALVTLSNDSWFAEGNGPRLHLVVSAFRSLETRRPQLRATNTGISAVITATGEIVTSADVHERKALVASITPAQTETLMLAWGDWFGRAALGCAVTMVALALFRPRRRS